MAVPEEIRKVPRPKNTVVKDNKTNSPYRYLVIQRVGTKYIKNGNPRPIDGGVIGHIIDGKFIPKHQKTSEIQSNNDLRFLQWGSAAIIRSLSTDILEDLLSVFDISRAHTIMSIAAIRVMNANCSCDRYFSIYSQSFLSLYYPKANFSYDYMEEWITKLGQATQSIMAFYAQRLERIDPSHHIATIKMVKQNNNDSHDLANFSYQFSDTIKDVSILYAYDLEQGEPVYSFVLFEYGELTIYSYDLFLKSYNLTRGIFVEDQITDGLTFDETLEQNKGFHYVLPLSKSSNFVNDYNLFSFKKNFKTSDSVVAYNKVETQDHKFLYSFLNTQDYRSKLESYINEQFKNDGVRFEKIVNQIDKIGTTAFISDLDLDAEAIFNGLNSQPIMKMIVDAYKSKVSPDLLMDPFSTIGDEFINFISSLITYRIINVGKEINLFKEMTYGSLIDELNSIWRNGSKSNINQLPDINDGYWNNDLPKNKTLVQKLKLCTPFIKVPKKEQQSSFDGYDPIRSFVDEIM